MEIKKLSKNTTLDEIIEYGDFLDCRDLAFSKKVRELQVFYEIKDTCLQLEITFCADNVYICFDCHNGDCFYIQNVDDEEAWEELSETTLADILDYYKEDERKRIEKEYFKEEE